MVTYEENRDQDGGDRDRSQTATDISCYIVLTLEPCKFKKKKSKWDN